MGHFKKKIKGFTPHHFCLKNSEGFTLIELMLVMAIIGLLSAGIVIVAARNSLIKAKDTRIMSEIEQIRNMAMIYFDDNNYTFTGFSCAAGLMSVLCSDITSQGGQNFLINVDPDGNSYCAEVLLNNGGWWCVDSYGRSFGYDSTTTPSEPACSAGLVYTCE